MTPEQELELLRLRARARARARTQGATPNAAPRNNGLNWGDIGASAVAGLQRAAAGFAGMAGDVRDIRQSIGRGLGLPEEALALDSAVSSAVLPGSMGASGNTQDQLRAIESVAGPIHEPETVAGEYARTIGEFAPGALAPGGALARTARVAIPAVATETAGQVARNVAPEAEWAVRLGVALASGIGTEGLVGRIPYQANPSALGRLQRELQDLGASANDARAVGAMIASGGADDAVRAAIVRATGADEARIARMPELSRRLRITPGSDVADLERRFMPLTEGERGGNRAAMQREASLRRAGPERAQAILQDFEENRASGLADNLMSRVATKGREPISDSSASAGTMLADDMRERFAQMQDRQTELYGIAMDRARNQAVAGSDELRANVGALVEREFLDAPQAVSIIDRLAGNIQRGTATYETVEHARQALNRVLGTALRSGDDAQVYSVRRIMGALDEWVEPRLNGEARQAISEARRFTAEMLSMFGEQSRPVTSTGHRGRRDLGGARVERIIESDIDADTVIDNIFGASTRPAAATQATVRRIADQARRTTNTNGYQAPTGGEGRVVRNAGRQTLRGGRATRGGRQFASPDEPIENVSLQALREAFVYRLTKPLTTRTPGDAIPMRTLRNNLRAALGPNRSITETIFNEAEMRELDDALRLIDRATPPAGSYMPSAPGIAQDAAERSLSAALARITRIIPFGVGEAISGAIDSGVVNARALRDARAAVTPSQPKPPRDLRRRTNPLGTEVAIAGALGAGNAARVEPDRPRRLGETEDQRWAREQLEAMGVTP